MTRAQTQTSDTFGFKWGKRETYESPAMQVAAKQWLIERYTGNDLQVLNHWLSGGEKRILDAGCGSAFSAVLLFGDMLKNHSYVGVDISDAVNVARERFLERGYPGEFIQSDLFSMDIPDASVDVIFSEGVLHHTDSVEKAIKHLSRKLKPKGRFLFYVYAKKGPVREFTDDYIRQAIAPFSDGEAWEALKPLGKLGIALGELNAEIDIPEAISFLGIPAGRINIQRLFYWYVCKMYYRPELSLDEMTHVNFDWFRPLNCHRSTPVEVTAWTEQAGLVIERMNVQEAGITVVARRL